MTIDENRLARVDFPSFVEDYEPPPSLGTAGMMNVLLNRESFDDDQKLTTSAAIEAMTASAEGSRSYGEWAERQWRRRVAELEDALTAEELKVDRLIHEFGNAARRVAFPCESECSNG